MKTKKSVSYEDGLMERLKDHEYAAGYLKTCCEEGDESFLMALRDVAKAYSFSKVSKTTKLGRESLYKSLSKKGNPTLSTLTSILDIAGLQLSVETKKAS